MSDSVCRHGYALRGSHVSTKWTGQVLRGKVWNADWQGSIRLQEVRFWIVMISWPDLKTSTITSTKGGPAPPTQNLSPITPPVQYQVQISTFYVRVRVQSSTQSGGSWLVLVGCWWFWCTIPLALSAPLREWAALFVAPKKRPLQDASLIFISVQQVFSFLCMKSDICPVNILLLPLCTENISYFDQEKDSWEAFHYGGESHEESQWPLEAGGGSAGEQAWGGEEKTRGAGGKEALRGRGGDEVEEDED